MISWTRKNVLSHLLRNRLEAVVVLVILVIALGMRLYKISGYMTFLGDEGRDALVVQGILVNHHIPLLGPPTSVGNMYLGPLYYYMMAVPMAVFWLNPVAAAVMVAIIGTMSVFLIYYLARAWFGKEAGILASILYSISPITIIYSRSSWNPNPAPFFALLSILGFHLARTKKDFRWQMLTGAALAFACQMHYLALILVPTFGLIWLYQLWELKKHRLEGKYFAFGSIGAVGVFLFLMSPLLIFDLRHNFINSHALILLLTAKDSGISFNLLATFSRILPIYNGILINDYLSGSIAILSPVISVLVLLPLGLASVKWFQNKTFKFSYLSLAIWLVLGLFGLSFYRYAIYDHYLGFLNPVPYLLLGGLIYFVQPKLKIWLVIILLAVLVPVNLMKSPLLGSPNNQLQKTQNVANFIIEQSGNKPFNFALLSEHNYDSAYQFYLGLYGHKPKVVPMDKTDQLFVVCEDPVCQPINNPKYEISAFGYAKIAYVKDFEGVKVFKIIPNPGGKPQ